ncbi:MAG: phage integrase SAM-like domain-containing protein [Bacteroidales bacterium]|nr:phage integrase SAM-like domain-containing protein [Bacteroidales bacterium]
MANIVYKLSTKEDKITGKREIHVRFYHGKFDVRAKTNLYVQPEYWDAAKQTVKIPNTRSNTPEKQQLIMKLSALKADLESLSNDIREAYIADGGGKRDLPTEWLSDFIASRILAQERIVAQMEEEETAEEKDDSQKEFFDTFEHFVSIQKISISRIRHYNVIIRALKRFAIYSAQEVSFATLSSDMLRKFSKFLENEHKFVVEGKDGKPRIKDPLYKAAYKSVPECRFPKQRGQNSIIGTMSRLHTFVRWSIKRGYMNRDPYDDYVIGTAIYGTPFYLTKEERNQLYQAKFPDNPGLDVQRDIFVFQCFIGCRVGDLMKMTKANIINGAIEYVPRKTKEGRPYTVRVPLSPTALEILERYKDQPDGRLLPFICEQDYNRDIKKMIKLAGIDRVVTTLNTITREEEKHPIWEVASSHMARRVLVGNLYKEVKDPNLIAKISGHVENSRAFSRYRDIDEEMAKEVILKLE